MRELIAAALLAAAPIAEAFADYKADYRAYVAALEAGDAVAAIEAGKKTWRAAEAELGDHKTVAVLAFNYANIVAPSDPAAAVEPYERALALARAGVSDLSAPELEIALLDSRFRSDDADATKSALRDALDTYAASGAPATDRTIGAWRTLALVAIGTRTRNPSFDEADGYLAEAERIAPPDQQSLAEAQLLSGMVRIAGDRRSAQDIAEAVVLLDKAIASYAPQESIDRFDPQLALSLAWRQSIRALIESAGSAPQFRTGSRIATSDDLQKAYERATASYDPQADRPLFKDETAGCQIEWKKRTPPPFPKGALVKSAIGAVLVGFDLGNDGVDRAVVLADLYGTGFGAAAVKSMADWRVANPPPAECRKNNLTFFSFVIR